LAGWSCGGRGAAENGGAQVLVPQVPAWTIESVGLVFEALTEFLPGDPWHASASVAWASPSRLALTVATPGGAIAVAHVDGCWSEPMRASLDQLIGVTLRRGDILGWPGRPREARILRSVADAGSSRLVDGEEVVARITDNLRRLSATRPKILLWIERLVSRLACSPAPQCGPSGKPPE
jgi:hypothetical protein